MDKLYELIERKRIPFILITYAYIVFLSVCMFPINTSRISQDFSFWLLMLAVYYYISHIFYGLYNKRPLFVFCFTFLFNSIGLLFRIFLECGEYSMTRELTPLNVGIYLILIPVLVTFIYVLLQLVNHEK